MFVCIYRHCVSGLGFGKGQLGSVSAAGTAEDNNLSLEGCYDCSANSPHKRGIRKRDTIQPKDPEEVKEIKIYSRSIIAIACLHFFTDVFVKGLSPGVLNTWRNKCSNLAHQMNLELVL